MIIFIKTISGEIYETEIEEDAFVMELKNQINEKRNLASSLENLKLIYKGKTLENSKQLDYYSIQDQDILLVLSSVKKEIKHKEQKESDVILQHKNHPNLGSNSFIDKKESFLLNIKTNDFFQILSFLLLCARYQYFIEKLLKKEKDVVELMKELSQTDPVLFHLIMFDKKGMWENKDNLNESNTLAEYSLQKNMKTHSALQDFVDDEFLSEETDSDQEDEKIFYLDESKIEKLAGFGFKRKEIEEALLICEGNEEMAANFLFDSSDKKKE